MVASLNARWDEWNAPLSDEEYEAEKPACARSGVSSLETFIPGVREKIDHIEAATPRTVNYYTKSMQGTSFGTKFRRAQGLHGTSPTKSKASTTPAPSASSCPAGSAP